MNSNNGKYLLALNAHQKIGGQTIKKILAAFDDLEELWQIPEQNIAEKLDPKITSLVIEARKQYDPDKQLENMKKYDIGYITMYDKEYPELLKEIYDCPVVLYIRGDHNALKQPALSVVGSRKRTNYGKKITNQLVCELVRSDLAIVSGLALGIDGDAHQAALESGGITIGVLGCGLDRIYPAMHLFLARRILEKGGAIISEYPPGTPTLKQNFPARNRIIAGLSLGTLVIEASEKSGSLITAYCALEYNREVFAVPGNIDSEFSHGCNLLIQRGAKLVTKAEDILAELNIEVKKAEVKVKQLAPETVEESTVLAILSSGERHVDDLVLESQLNIIALLSVLTILEMKGNIENIGGGRYRKIC